MARKNRGGERANRNQSNEWGQTIAMSITDIVNRKTGAVGGPTAAIQDVSAMVAKSLEGLVETKKLASAAEAVKALMAEDSQPSDNTFTGLKELGINIGDMMQFQANQARMAQEELHKTREQVIEEKVRVAEFARQDQVTANSFAQQMMAVQNQSFENQMKLMTQMYEQRIKDLENTGRKPDNDPVTQFMTQMSMGLLKDRLTTQPLSAQDQIGEAMSLVNTLKNIFVANAPNASIEQEFNRLKIDLEMRKLDIEQEERAAEREERRSREESRSKTVGELLGQLAELVPVAVELIKNKPPAPAAQPMQPMQPMMPMQPMQPMPAPSFNESVPSPYPPYPSYPSLYPSYMSPDFATGGRYDDFNAGAPRQAIQSTYSQIVCPNCGENFDMQQMENGACPRCGTQLFAPAPLPHNSRPSSRGGVLEI